MRLCSALVVSSLVGSLSLAGGCTLLVWRDASGPALCEDDGDCPAGEVCGDGSCDVVATDAVGREGTRIDIEGGVVTGPDGVVLTIPAGAVDVATTFIIRKTTSTLPRDNFVNDGAFYAIEPARSLAAIARLQLPGDASRAFLRPEDQHVIAWQELTLVDGQFGLPRTGVVARGERVTP